MDLLDKLRSKYPKKGPNPGKDINEWARKYMDQIGKKVMAAETLIRQKLPTEDICKKTGLKMESVESLRSSKKRKENKK